MKPLLSGIPFLSAIVLLMLGLQVSTLASASSILFVGNSFTFGRVNPVMSYNAASVHDLTAAFMSLNPAGSNPWEPHPWGGVPGIFKKMTDQAGLHYDVYISARNGVSLRGQFLDLIPVGSFPKWTMRENLASRKWDVVVLQEQSDATLPGNKGKNASPLTFNAYVDQCEQFIHRGTIPAYYERDLFGGLANCTASEASGGAGLSSENCNAKRVIAHNPNASAATRVYLTQTWARPDMVYAHKLTHADQTDPEGRPKAVHGKMAKTYYSSLSEMTKDLHQAFFSKAKTNPNITGVIAVGDAFQAALDVGLAKKQDFYDANGVFLARQDATLMNLWWKDLLHASKYGSYLAALMHFGSITGVDPQKFGASEQAAIDLQIHPREACALQQLAASQLGFPVLNRSLCSQE